MAIDISLINRAAGTRAAQPVATTVEAGTFYSLTDEAGNIERSDKIAWSKWGPQVFSKIKAADESISSSTTLQDDNDLIIPIGASENWVIKMMLYVLSASATPGFKITIVAPSGASGNWRENSGNTVNAFGATRTIALAAATDKLVEVAVGVVNSTNAGNVKLQWAQGVSDATAVLVKAFSGLLAIKV